jgi:hypothetical protein
VRKGKQEKKGSKKKEVRKGKRWEASKEKEKREVRNAKK